MSEFMGMISGVYDAKKNNLPGGATLHSMMTPHGPDTIMTTKASNEELKPVKLDNNMVIIIVLVLREYCCNYCRHSCLRLHSV